MAPVRLRAYLIAKEPHPVTYSGKGVLVKDLTEDVWLKYREEVRASTEDILTYEHSKRKYAWVVMLLIALLWALVILPTRLATAVYAHEGRYTMTAVWLVSLTSFLSCPEVEVLGLR